MLRKLTLLENNVLHSNFLANNGNKKLDEAFFSWAVKVLNPQATITSIQQSFENMSQRYDNPKRFFHRGLGHPRSLFPITIQKIYKECYLQPDDAIKIALTTNIILLAQKVLAAFYHDVVHRNDDKASSPVMLPLTAVLFDEAKDPLPVEILSCLVAEEHFAQMGISSKLSLPILLAIIATIPFSKFGEPQNVLDRLQSAARQLGITFLSTEIPDVLQMVLSVADRDLGSYGEDTLCQFNQKTWAMMFERHPEIAEENHSLLEEAAGIKTFYLSHQALLKKFKTHQRNFYDSVNDKPITKKLHLQAIEKISLDILLQGIQLGSLAILANVISQYDKSLLHKPLKHVLQHVTVRDFLDAYSHLTSPQDAVPSDVIDVLRNHNQMCKVNGVTIPFGSANGEFTLQCLQRIGADSLLGFANIFADQVNEVLPLLINPMRLAFKPHLLLYVDINGTIMLADPVSGKDTLAAINELLAKKFSAVWGEHSSEKMTYREYVETFLCPGNSQNLDVKKSRIDFYRNFIPYLKQSQHELLAEVQAEYQKYYAIYGNTKDNVMPSFIFLIQYLDDNAIPYSIILKTFGVDLQPVVDELEAKTSLKFNRGMSVTEEGYVRIGDTILKEPEDMLAYHVPGRHYACQDNYDRWEALKFSYAGGKPFPIGNGKLSVMLEDHSLDKKILQVVCDKKLGLGCVDQKKLQSDLIKLGRIVAVETSKASLEMNYFIEKIQAVYQAPLRLQLGPYVSKLSLFGGDLKEEQAEVFDFKMGTKKSPCF